MDTDKDKDKDKDQDNTDLLRPALWYWTLGLMVFVVFQSIGQMLGTTQVAYSDFKRLLESGKVNEVTVSDVRVWGTLKAEGLENVLPKQQAEALKCNGERGCPFSTVRVTDPDLVRQLEDAQVRFVGENQSKWFASLLTWVLPLVLMIWLWSSLAKRSGMMSGGIFDIGKSKARVYVQSKTGVTFEDVAGIDEARDELIEIVEFLKDPQRYRRLAARFPRGC